MDKKWWTFTNLSAAVFRQNIKTALLATGIDPTDEAIGYIARRMCEADGRHLLDEVTALKSRAQRVLEE